jgi:uncharacterized membrane protein SpoIIM required for sporulation
VTLDHGPAATAELEQLLRRAGSRPERLGADGVLRLGALHRAAVADLAVARRRLDPGDPELVRLETLVGRARQAVYAGDAEREGGIRAFFLTTYWRHVAERPGLLAIAAALLLLPAVGAALWAGSDPDAALGLVPGEFRQAVEPVGDTGMTAEETAAFSGAVLTNNIQVTFTAFALGLLAGLGTAAVVLYNGLVLGAITGGAVAAGNGPAFVEFVAAHGVIELSCIVVAAAAGLRLGGALVDPGPLPRGAALAAEARPAMAVVLGTVPWLVLAGFIEGFVTRSGFGLWPGLALGVAVGAVFWGLVVLRGAPAPSP